MLKAFRTARDAILNLPPTRALIVGLGLSAAYAILLGVAHVVPRYDAVVFPLVAGAIVGALGNVHRRWLLAAFIGSAVLLALGVLVHLWTTGHEGRSAVLFGIVPYSDAGDFYGDAERMVHGLRFGPSSRRPLYVAVAGALLRWSGEDLRRLLIIQTLAYGASMGFVTWEVLRAHGRFAATIVLAITYFWVRRFTGFVATEALAFPLGALGFGLLVRVADAAQSGEATTKQVRDNAIALGLAIMAITLGLIARPGALLVVPAVLLWSFFAFRGRARLLVTAGGVIGIVVALVATRAVTSRLSSGATFGDYPTIVYALIHRGELFQAFMDHPELTTMDPMMRGHAVFSILLSDIRQHPSLLVLGPADAFVSFLVGPHGFFSFVWTNPDDHVLENGPLVRKLIAEHGYIGPVLHWIRQLGVFSLFNAVVMGLLGGVFAIAAMVATVRLFRRRREADARTRLVLYVLGGILASSVFAPTWIGEGMQMESAVFAFVPLAVGLGIRRRGDVEASASEPTAPSRSSERLTTFTASVIALGVLAVVTTCAWPISADRGDCGVGRIHAKLLPSTRTVVRPPTEPTPNEASLATNLEFLARHNGALVASVKSTVRTGDVVEVVYDACSERTRIAVGAPELLPPTMTWTTLHFDPQKEPALGRVSAP